MALIIFTLYFFIFSFFSIGNAAFGGTPESYKSWVQEMKTNPRGPFSRIRWYCNDGTVQEPSAYACTERGGGVQHGEWTEAVKSMRNDGYHIANVFAGLNPDLFVNRPDHMAVLKQMILEQFLIRADDGWIFRKARFYRGALQAEDEERNGKQLLEAILDNYHHIPEQFLLLREAVRLIPHHHRGAPVSRMRRIALDISESDERFVPLRTKLHIRPDPGDAKTIRVYAGTAGKQELADQYELLARTIDAVFRPAQISPVLNALADRIASSGSAKASDKIKQGAAALASETDSVLRLKAAAALMVELRNALALKTGPGLLLEIMDASILLEDEAFRLTAEIHGTLPGLTVARSLDLLADCADIAYGTGLLSSRQHGALLHRLKKSKTTGRNIGQFRSDLIHAARASGWSERALLFHFSRAVAHFHPIEPLAGRYVHDRLHGSTLYMYSIVLNRLMTDNSRQLGLTNAIWGRPVAAGINGLNPGITRGVLRAPGPGQIPAGISKDSILVLPATTPDLPPVAGIITAGEGNILSHIQLLARNLGIPNVAVDKTVLPPILSAAGSPIVLAVSPKGIVRIEKDSPEWKSAFARKAAAPRTILKADTEKLKLHRKKFVTLSEIRANDSGRIAGPKAANLGELKHHFPEAVTQGVVIPFGRFRQLLDHPVNDPALTSDPGLSMFDWMARRYKEIKNAQADPARQKSLIESTLGAIRSWILSADPGADFKRELKQKLAEALGPDGSYGVFVRSDTNVEDLPGFTGAGLNLTVPHVVGFENIYQAVKRVWASPFTLRSFGWRHAYLENPEHVYTSVLLMKTVSVEKSGVMVTKNLTTGQRGWLTIAVNEGVGGAVSGQTAEELLIRPATGEVTLLSQATEPLKRTVLETGGMDKIPASGTDAVLSPEEISQLIAFAGRLPHRFPALRSTTGQVPAADVEFGFLKGRLVLFQIRPLVDDALSQKDKYLAGLDRMIGEREDRPLDLNRIPLGETP